MVITLGTKLHTMDGKVLTQDKPRMDEDGKVIGSDKEDVVFGHMLKIALLQAHEEDKKVDEKVTRFELSLRLVAAKDKEIDLEAEDIVLLKKLVGRMYAPLVVGQVFRLLEGKPTGLDPDAPDEVETEEADAAVL